MDSWKLGLTINGQWYDHRELLAYSSHQIVSVINPWEKEIYRFIINWLSDLDYIIQYSSGTTGKPKEIRLQKVSMMQSARITCDYLKIREGSTSLLCMPVDYIAGRMMIVRSMVAGLNMLIVEPRSFPDIETLPHIDFTAMVPLQVINLLSCKSDLKLGVLLIGGAEISTRLENLLMPVTAEVYATYGMAESSSHIALRHLNGIHREQNYHVLPGVTIAADERSCLIIKAPWIPNTIHTNDLVELTGNDTFRWLGRYDNLINSGGVKIVPEEVESYIALKTGMECVALGVNDPKLGQKLVLVIENADQITIAPADLKIEFDNVLPRLWRPKELRFVNKFPRKDSLKVDRRKLARMIG